jgi:hypothetical protein
MPNIVAVAPDYPGTTAAFICELSAADRSAPLDVWNGVSDQDSGDTNRFSVSIPAPSATNDLFLAFSACWGGTYMASGTNFTAITPVTPATGVFVEYCYPGSSNAITATVYSDVTDNPYCMIGVGLRHR